MREHHPSTRYGILVLTPRAWVTEPTCPFAIVGWYRGLNRVWLSWLATVRRRGLQGGAKSGGASGTHAGE